MDDSVQDAYVVVEDCGGGVVMAVGDGSASTETSTSNTPCSSVNHNSAALGPIAVDPIAAPKIGATEKQPRPLPAPAKCNSCCCVA